MNRSLLPLCLLLLCVMGLLPILSLRAQTPPSDSTANQTTTERPANTEKGAVISYTLPPDKYARAVALARSRNRLHFIGVAYGLLVLILFLVARVGPAFRSWAEAVSRRRFVQALIFVPLVLLLWSAFELPLAVYGHRLQLQYNLSVQNWGSWFWDWTKELLITLVLGTLLIWILYGIIRRSGRRWWFYFWLASLPILIFLFFLTPVVLDPLFNKFDPLEARQPVLVRELEKVVKRGGLSIPPDRMYEMRASEKVTTLNAYVTGLGATKRVVVWDTTIQRLSVPQILFVFGHEMGHYVLGHIYKGIAFAAGLLLVLSFLIFRATRWAVRRWGTRLAIRGIDDWASLPLLMLFFFLFTFLAEPVFNSFSRYQEHQADIYGLEVTHGIVPNAAQSAAESFQILGETSLADPAPSPFVKFWLYDHPPIAERLRFALRYDPWSRGQPPEFVR